MIARKSKRNKKNVGRIIETTMLRLDRGKFEKWKRQGSWPASPADGYDLRLRQVVNTLDGLFAAWHAFVDTQHMAEIQQACENSILCPIRTINCFAQAAEFSMLYNLTSSSVAINATFECILHRLLCVAHGMQLLYACIVFTEEERHAFCYVTRSYGTDFENGCPHRDMPFVHYL